MRLTPPHKLSAEIMSRMKLDIINTHEHRGDTVIEAVAGGTRIYTLRSTFVQPRAENRYLMLAGLLLAFASLFGFLVEARLRQLRSRIAQAAQ